MRGSSGWVAPNQCGHAPVFANGQPDGPQEGHPESNASPPAWGKASLQCLAHRPPSLPPWNRNGALWRMTQRRCRNERRTKQGLVYSGPPPAQGRLWLIWLMGLEKRHLLTTRTIDHYQSVVDCAAGIRIRSGPGGSTIATGCGTADDRQRHPNVCYADLPVVGCTRAACVHTRAIVGGVDRRLKMARFHSSIRLALPH